MKAPTVRALLLLACAAASLPAAGAELQASLGGRQVSVGVRSLLEIRDDRLVRQGWDVSCGAAALSTVLTHWLDTPYSELAVAVSMLANTDPAVVRSRGGFSLLDLKRFAQAVGLEAQGFGGLTLDDLDAAAVPAILPVRIHGLDHFVVFRDRMAGRVMIGDPAFGNLVLPERRFARMWQSGIGMFVSRPGAPEDRGRRVPDSVLELGIADLAYVYRVTRGAGALPGGPP